MPLSDDQLRDLVRQLATRPGHESVRGDIRTILVYHLGVPIEQIELEANMAQVRGRADALIARTILEFKSDLRNEIDDAERQLTTYLLDSERTTGLRFVGVAADGADFRAYQLRRDKLVRLKSEFNLRNSLRDHRDNAAEAGHALADWLGSFLTLRPELRPEPATIRIELGRESAAFEIAASRLEDLWREVKDRADVKLKRQLWAERLRLVYGDSVDDDALFFQHTYLTIVAKTMATLVLGAEPPPAAELLGGRPFQDAGIHGVVESDFFDWILAAPGGADAVGRISAQVARFRLGDIKHDVLKVLYESLIDPEQRHDLGEYYTPDWLAQRVCERAIERPLEQRVLDPSCGSGTFLFHAVRRFLAAADATGMPTREALSRCAERIFGIDVHPVAVINARVTYLLAIGEARLKNRPPLSIPVYLGDSLQWNTEQILVGQTVHISVPPQGEEEERDPRKVPNLTFPIRVAANPALFDDVVGEMLRLSEQGASTDAFAGWLERKGDDQIPPELRQTLSLTFGNLRKLRKQERNHIWGYVARNLSRPVWLATQGEKVDVLIGNPPWLAQRNMSREMQRRFREECKARGIWAGGKVATHQDLSAYFFARCVELYLQKGGAIAFVMPFATMTRQQYRPFRTGVFAGRVGARQVRVYGSVSFTDAWTFDDSVQLLFNVPSCVLFAREGEPGALPAKVMAYSGKLLRRDASAKEAAEALTFRQQPWPETNSKSTSPYGPRFRNGATVFPRLFFLVRHIDAGRFGANPDAPNVESRRPKLEKAPWKHLKSLRGPIEKEFLRSLYLGESIAHFRLLASVQAVIPWESETGRLLDASAAQRSGYGNLARWLDKAEALWKAHGHQNITLLERLDKFHALSHQMPPSRLRVLYGKSGKIPAAAILTDNLAVVENTTYWTTAESSEEAYYLVAIINSETLRARIASRQSVGQWGARHFDKLLIEMIPQFNKSSPLHAELSKAAELAEKIAASVELPETIHFVRARKLIRDALRADGIANLIDRLVARVLDGKAS